MIADLAVLFQVAICLHNVSGLMLNMASRNDRLHLQLADDGMYAPRS